MLNNFIYAKKKSLFTKELEAGNVLDEAIAFIEDTGEIWNHGKFFASISWKVIDAFVSVTNTTLNMSAEIYGTTLLTNNGKIENNTLIL